MKSGIVTIVGRPNVGKSSILNYYIGSKLSIISSKPQTTLNRITGIYNDPDFEQGLGLQIVFVDTPGIHKPHNKLGEIINETARSSLQGSDLTLNILDANRPITQNSLDFMSEIIDASLHCILVFNKIDLISNEDYIALLELVSDLGFDEIIAVSATRGTNMELLLKTITKYMPDGPMYYPYDYMTDRPERFIVSEIIREKLLIYLNDEIPHGVYVTIDEYQEMPRLVRISATIACEKKSHKRIIIGKDGHTIKGIGMKAREDIEALLGCKVFLNLFVKIEENWRNDIRTLKEIGIKE